jgi:Immunoglobulin-like domain of bacterial spore germination
MADGSHITGNANVFEASFRITLLDSGGRTLFDDHVMATCGTGCRGTFDHVARYSVGKAQWGTLRVWVGSAVDGSPRDIREYPVWLTP